MTTYDLNVVHSCRVENAERTLDALEEMNSHSRLHQKKIRSNKSHLVARGHLLQTRFGHLDLLEPQEMGLTFDELVTRSFILYHAG